MDLPTLLGFAILVMMVLGINWLGKILYSILAELQQIRLELEQRRQQHQ
jgi:hypothetical protein